MPSLFSGSDNIQSKCTGNIFKGMIFKLNGFRKKEKILFMKFLLSKINLKNILKPKKFNKKYFQKITYSNSNWMIITNKQKKK